MLEIESRVRKAKNRNQALLNAKSIRKENLEGIVGVNQSKFRVVDTAVRMAS